MFWRAPLGNSWTPNRAACHADSIGRGCRSFSRFIAHDEARERIEVSQYESKEQEELVRFVGGPYEPPFVPIGGWLKCKVRGNLKVGGYTNALIPWPTASGHFKRLIVCGDLVKAAKTRSCRAESYHFKNSGRPTSCRAGPVAGEVDGGVQCRYCRESRARRLTMRRLESHALGAPESVRTPNP